MDKGERKENRFCRNQKWGGGAKERVDKYDETMAAKRLHANVTLCGVAQW
jgi:hypothetical protein